MKKILVWIGFVSSLLIQASGEDCCSSISKNIYQPHAFSAYSSREIMLMKQAYVNVLDRDNWQGTLSFATEYMQNFGKNCYENLGAMPFWSGTNQMTIGTNDGKSDLDAYQFGMGDVTKVGTISLKPRVQHVGTDMLLHFTQNKFGKGFYFKVKAPLGAMSIHSKLEEDAAVLNNAVDTTWLSYPSPNNRYKTLTEAFNGGSVDLTGTLAKTGVSSNLHKPIALEKGRISCCKLTAIRFADISATVGWNVIGSEKGFLGLGFKLSCPTGNVPESKFIMEPIFGRAGHWGVGAELSGSYKLWSDQASDKSLDMWVQSEIIHLMHGRRPSWRSFDLAQNGPGSKYMLLQFYFAGNDGYVPSFVTQAVNVTTLPVLSSFSVEGSTACMFDYKSGNWNYGIGFDFWARSKEKLDFDQCNLINENIANLNDYAVLGRQISEDAGTSTELFRCEPLARINKSQPRQIAAVLPAQYASTIKDARLSENRIPGNLYEALDVCGAAEQRVFTGKLFGQVGYTWKLHNYNPNLSIYGSVELAESKKNMANLWSVGLQSSLNF